MNKTSKKQNKNNHVDYISFTVFVVVAVVVCPFYSMHFCFSEVDVNVIFLYTAHAPLSQIVIFIMLPRLVNWAYVWIEQSKKGFVGLFCF